MSKPAREGHATYLVSSGDFTWAGEVESHDAAIRKALSTLPPERRQRFLQVKIKGVRGSSRYAWGGGFVTGERTSG